MYCSKLNPPYWNALGDQSIPGVKEPKVRPGTRSRLPRPMPTMVLQPTKGVWSPTPLGFARGDTKPGNVQGCSILTAPWLLMRNELVKIYICIDFDIFFYTMYLLSCINEIDFPHYLWINPALSFVEFDHYCNHLCNLTTILLLVYVLITELEDRYAAYVYCLDSVEDTSTGLLCLHRVSNDRINASADARRNASHSHGHVRRHPLW